MKPEQTSISAQQLDREGYAIIAGELSEAQIGELRRVVENLPDDEAVRRRGDSSRSAAYGVRNLFELVPKIRELAQSRAIRALVEPILGGDCFAVRAILFDKIAEANWKVGWHQDKFIAVAEKIDVVGFGPWSMKAGVWQVIPPVDVLQRMLTLRIHLDDCFAENGPLRVLPGTHCHGWLDGEVSQWRSRAEEVSCEAASGGVLVMRPLLLHSSSRATSPSHRRVIHLEFAEDELPSKLQWHQRVTDSG